LEVLNKGLKAVNKEKDKNSWNNECNNEEDIKNLGDSFTTKKSFEGFNNLATTALEAAEKAPGG
jgi:hypothetical protein